MIRYKAYISQTVPSYWYPQLRNSSERAYELLSGRFINKRWHMTSTMNPYLTLSWQGVHLANVRVESDTRSNCFAFVLVPSALVWSPVTAVVKESAELQANVALLHCQHRADFVSCLTGTLCCHSSEQSFLRHCFPLGSSCFHRS